MEKASYILLVFLIACAAGAYAQVGDGSISGFVQDEQKAFITGAQIVLRSEALMGKRITNSGANGGYRIINLPPGIYTVEVSKDNYQTVEYTNINVRAGKTSSFNITLKVGEFTETLTIIHDSPIIDVKNPERSLNIDGDFISRMPLHPSREWSQVWSFVPGVDFKGSYITSTGSTYHTRQPLDSINVHGQGATQNLFTLDGMTLNGVFENYNSTTFSTEIIEDVQVITGGYNASLSPGNGGYINVVTKSGGNDLHGSAVFTLQPSAWNWSNVEGGDSADLESYIPEVSLGGPVLKDKVWFFMGYRYDHSNLGVSRTADQLAMFDKFGITRPASKIKKYGHRYFGKLTANISETDKVVFTYNWDRNFYEGPTGYNAWQYADSAIGRALSGGPLYLFEYNRVWSGNFTTTFKYSHRNFKTGEDPDFNSGPEIWRYGGLRVFPTFVFGDSRKGLVIHGGVGDVSNRRNTQSDLRGDANLYVDGFFGGHDIVFGFNGRPKSKSNSHSFYPEGYYRGEEALSPVNGEWTIFVQRGYQRESNENFIIGSETWGGYIQDDWGINDRLTLNIGLRMQRDYDNAGGVYKSGNISGNFGATYALTGDQRQTVRFSYARRLQEINGNRHFQFNEIERGNAGSIYRADYNFDGEWDVIRNYDPSDSIPRSHDDIPDHRWADDYGPEKTDNFQLGYTTILPFNVKLDAAYLYIIRSDLHVSSIFDNHIWEDDQIVGVKDPDFLYLYFYYNDKWASVHYNSFELLATKEFSDGWQLITSYTWQDSTLKGEWSPYNPHSHYYPQSWFETSHYGNNPTHMLNLAASVMLPYDITFNANINSRSGYFENPRRHVRQPVDFYLTLPDGTTTMNPAYYTIGSPFAQPRNAERSRGEAVTTINLGLGKQFNFGPYRISTQFQLFNVLNSGSYTRFYDASYDENMQPVEDFEYLDIQSPRAAQLLVKMTF